MTPDEIEKIVIRATNEGVNFPWWLYIMIFFSAFIGTYLASYLKKKGENTATKENYDSLLSQVEKTTIVTESIKSDLSSGNWLSQQSWFLKEKYYSLLLNELYKLKQSLSSQLDHYIQPGSEHNDMRINKNKHYIKQSQIGGDALERIKNMQGSSEIVISDRARDSLHKLHDNYWDANFESSHNKEYLDTVFKSVDATYATILEEAKADLKQ